MYKLLSYSLEPSQVVMPGAIDKPKLIKRSRMVSQPDGNTDTNVRWGSYNNTSVAEFFVHTGTHIDVPFHVDPDGFKLHEFTIENFIFNHPLLLEIPKSTGEKITVDDLKPYTKELSQADIVLFYTGFSKTRLQDPAGFVNNQPSFSVDAACFLVDNFNIRAFGIDTIGIENIPEGKAGSPVQFPVHKTFLLKKHEKTFVIEDLDLTPVLGKKVRKVFVIPLLLYGFEAMPVTVFAEVEG